MGSTGDQGFVLTLLQLLFGQTGALGTVLIVAYAWQAWLYLQERNDHKETRRVMQEASDKRTEIFESYIKVVGDLKVAMDLIAAKNR